MPAPIDVASQYSRPLYNNAPYGSSFPKQEVNLDFYEFQPATTSSENETIEQDYSQKLESSFCRDFSCCGLLLEDLHDLLQHYEECHVRFEEEDLHCNFYEEDWSDGSPPNSPPAPAKQTNGGNASNGSNSGNNGNIGGGSSTGGGPNPVLKRKAVSLSDIYAEERTFSPDDSSAFDTSVLRSSPTAGAPKKRNLNQFTAASTSMDMSASIKRLAINITQNNGLYSGLPTPTEDELFSHDGALFVPASSSAATTGNFMITAEELMVRKQEALCTMEQHISRPSSALIVDKPYKCPVSGCDKAYKNPNGLKYHNQHGHCNTLSANEDRPSLKPYQCTVANCGKRYKNLNGLKYHIEHHHLPSLVIGQITPDSTPLTSSMPTPMTTPITTPMTTPLSTPLTTPLSSPVMTPLIPNQN